MTSRLAASAQFEGPRDDAAPLDGGVSIDTSPAALFSNWPAPVERPSFRSRDLYGVLAASALLHVGIAAAAYRAEDAPTPKRVSRVEIEMTRPRERPRPPTPAAVPPPPPKVIKQESKPRAAAPPTPEPPRPVPVETPPDTGSSAPAAEDGELHSGAGGLGTATPTPPAPPAPAVVPVAAPVVQAREGANYLKNPRPAYPRKAKRDGLEGTTLLRVVVLPSGKPSAVRIQKSSGHDLLDEAALEAVNRWTFVPATRGGEAIAGSVTVPIVFRLQ